MTVSQINLSDITVDPTPNIRASIDEGTVEHYREVLDQCPPLVAFTTKDGLLLADGFHRVEAARREGRASTLVDVQTGTRDDANAFAATANLRRGRLAAQGRPALLHIHLSLGLSPVPKRHP